MKCAGQLEYKQLWSGGQVLAVPPALRVLWSYSERKSPVTK
ncbi:transposase, IS605 OrfB family protein [Shigella boydii 4444-74]|uniref:Transposase, IS605 OrfB family protein n=1 Tax=Shigella boydii 4444-74 TaxID=766140 RepID=I6DI29_SHIBO|nr:transposase, IS605 OrfB family protein [Shigella boydii 4444-74]